MTEKLFKHQIIRLGSNHDGGYFVYPNAVSKDLYFGIELFNLSMSFAIVF
ncbi:hypothetical protein N9I27_01655 [Flavobacteriaceae bacterium]|nr:hypothetical protein [Flavobacteriaceae bacterium]